MFKSCFNILSTFVFLLASCSNAQNLKLVPKEGSFYIVDSVPINTMSREEKFVLDSLLKVYHSNTEAIKKLEVLMEVPELVTDINVWPSYVRYVKNRVNEMLRTGTGNKREIGELNNMLAKAHNAEGVMYLYLGENENSLSSFSLALSIATKNANQALEAEIYNSLGGLYQYKGDLSMAADYFKKSLKLFEQIKDKPSQALLYYNLGQVYIAQQNYPEAIRCAQESASISEKTANKIDLQSAYALIGTIFRDQNDGQKSFEYYEKAFRISESIGSSGMASEGLLNMSRALKQQGKDSVALEYALKARDYALKAQNTILLQQNLQNLAELFYSLNLLDKTFETAQEGLKLARTNSNQALEVGLLNILARTYLSSGNTAKALECAENGHKLANTIQLLGGVIESASVLQEIYSKKGEWQKAYNMLSLLDKLNAKAAAEENKKEMYKKIYQFEFEKKELKLKEEQITKDAIAAQQKITADLKIKQGNYMILGLVLFAILIVSVFLLILRQNKLVAIQKSTLIEQKLLRSQMNPHFIFNCLQAITNFTNEVKVKKYLSSFGSVTRSVLENSRKEMVTIKNEVQLLEHYLQLQKMLYGNKFEYGIKVSQNIDLELTEIPPMLAQPFIENAIEHGFKGLESGGMIEVEFHLAADKIVLTVKDNGKGISKFNESNHRSLATTITAERIAVLNKRSKRKASFTISEAFPDCERKGVLVTFEFPV